MKKMIAVVATIVMALSFPGFAQTTDVKILVEDSSSGKPLAGATVHVKGSMLRNQTRENGILELKGLKPGSHQLAISYIGYKDQSITITLPGPALISVPMVAENYLADEVFVQATRARQDGATTFRNITREEIAEENLGQDLPYVLEHTPSVVVSSDAGAGVGYTNMRIRGSDNQRINVTINGIPYNDAESMGTFFVNMPDFVSSVDNIQIQRGVGTSTNGAGAFGASVNIQTTQRIDTAYAELANSFGSYNTLKNTVSFGTGLINEKFSFDGRLSRIKSDGYIDRATSDLKSFFLSGAWYGSHNILRANVFSGKERTYQAWNGVPEELLDSNRTYNEFTYKDQTDNYTQTHYQLLYSHSLTKDLIINTALHYTRGQGFYEEYKEAEAFELYGFKPIRIGNSVIDSTDLARRRWLDNHFYGATYSARYTPYNNLSVTIGGAYNEYLGDHFGEVIWARYASDHSLGDRYYDNDAKKRDFNVYGKANYSTGRWDFFADVQYRTIQYSYQGVNRDLSLLQQHIDLGFLNPKIGATFNLPQGGNLYTSFAIANKEPIRRDYTDSPPDDRPQPERLADWELGYRKRETNYSININAYGMFYKDQLVTTGRINDVGSAVRENVPKSYRAGIEVDAAWEPIDRFRWSLAAAVSENKILDYTYYIDELDANWDVRSQKAINLDKTDLAMSPNIVISNELSYSPLRNAGVSLINQYVSRQYLDNTGEKHKSIAPYFLTHLRFKVSPEIPKIKNVDITLKINNLLSTLYESGGYTFSYYTSGGDLETYNYYFPQATANFMFGVNLKF